MNLHKRAIAVMKKAGDIIVNNVSYSGKTIHVDNNSQVYIDGQQIEILEKHIVIHLVGNVDSVITASGDVNVSGDVTCNVSTASGNVDVDGNVGRDVSTMSGDISIKGSTSGHIKTMSGDVTIH